METVLFCFFLFWFIKKKIKNGKKQQEEQTAYNPAFQCTRQNRALTSGRCIAQSSRASEWPSNAGDQSGGTLPQPAIPRFWPAGGEELPFPQTASALEFQTLVKNKIKKKNQNIKIKQLLLCRDPFCS